mgnify:CR=1 FL=1
MNKLTSAASLFFINQKQEGQRERNGVNKVDGVKFLCGRGALAPITHNKSKLSLRKKKKSKTTIQQHSIFLTALWRADKRWVCWWACRRAVARWCAACCFSFRSINWFHQTSWLHQLTAAKSNCATCSSCCRKEKTSNQSTFIHQINQSFQRWLNLIEWLVDWRDEINERERNQSHQSSFS